MVADIVKKQTKYAFVTGASSGLGFEYTRELLKYGYNIIAVSRNADIVKHKLQKFFPEQKIITWNYDLTKQENYQVIFEKCQAYNITLVLNNAGFGYSGFYLDNTWQNDLKMINLNIIALHNFTFHFTKYWLKHKIKGRVINVGSIAGLGSGPLSATYSATKSYVNMWSTSVNAELRKNKNKIKVICIAPGPIKTNFQSRAKSLSSTENLKTNTDLHVPSFENEKIFLPIEHFCRISLKRSLKKNPKQIIIVGTQNKVFQFLLKLASIRMIQNYRFKFVKKIYK